MELEENASGRDRIARMLAAAGLTVAAAALLKKGRRFTGAFVGAGALALGYQAASESPGLKSAVGSDSGKQKGQIHCAICGEPIVPGQARGPDENDNTVHIDCRESTAETAD